MIGPDYVLTMESKTKSRIRGNLLNWFAEHARELPWRSDPTPYKVWISEIMCQQTQIATVIPYFERFLAKYPDETTLAASDEDELVRLWEGLGYYRRARALRVAAQRIVEQHDGRFPLTFDEVLALPGIGRYTAGAILSISRNQRLPILEGNTVRVFSRWIGLRIPVNEKPGQEILWSFSQSMLPKAKRRDRGPAAFNQAAMELGALICTPREPKCLVCPVARDCVANANGWQSQIPGKVTKTKYESRNEFAALIRDASGDYLVRQTPPGSRFAGMWDFPKAGPPEARDVSELASWLASDLGGKLTVGETIDTIKHAVTKYRITLQLHAMEWDFDGEVLPENYRFRSAQELAEMPMSATGRKLLDQVSRDA